MKLFKYLCLLLPLATMVSCKKELNVGNPNQPTFESNVKTESGLVSFAIGGIYLGSLGDFNLALSTQFTWLGDSYFSLPYGYSELLADQIGAEAANQIINVINIPDYYILDNGTKITNAATHRSVLRSNNNRAASGQGINPLFYQWMANYLVNNTCNIVLKKVDEVSYTGDADTKKKTLQAFAYWWKGWAYANIGSMYYAGLIVNEPGEKNDNYRPKEEIIAESNANFKKAADILATITNNADYDLILGQLIPAFNQTGHGGVPTPDEWIHNINTMLARNVLVNKLSPFVNKNPDAVISGASISPMTQTDWTEVLNLATAGIKNGDVVFTGRSTAANGYFTTQTGTVSAMTTGDILSSTFKVSERFIQNFKPGDKRFANNFDDDLTFTSGGTFGSRYSQVDGGNGMAGVYVYGNKTVGEYELYMAGSYEENALMLAEANIRLGNIETGLGYIDDVRAYQGAGLPAVKGKGLNLAQALQELVQERRVALIYRGISFYDSRRWGWIYDISKGGGVYGATVLNGTTVNTNVTINYNFLDYWDIPADEIDLNPPAAGSAPVVNPN